MFEIETFTDLVFKSLPLRLQLPELRSLMAAFAKARRPQLTAEARAWRHDYMTWRYDFDQFCPIFDQNLSNLVQICIYWAILSNSAQFCPFHYAPETFKV